MTYAEIYQRQVSLLSEVLPVVIAPAWWKPANSAICDL
jgi:hypothetical protein